MSRVFGLIPARMESSRLYGKALKLINGIPMVVHVALRSQLCTALNLVAVCTDSRQIAQVCAQYGVNVILTGNRHRNGTERIAEAVDILCLSQKDVVIDIQGDEALVDPDSLHRVVSFYKSNDFDIVVPYNLINAEQNQNIVKIIEVDGRVLYMSRATVPHPFNEHVEQKKHLSTVAFSTFALKRFAAMEPTPLEKIESIELLRALEIGMSVGTFHETNVTVAVDTEGDLEKVRRMINSDEHMQRY